MKKTTLLLAVLALSGATHAANLTYSYAYSLMPSHQQGGAIYADDLHSGPAGIFDATGDLNDGLNYTGSNPVTDNPNSMVAWSTTGGVDTPAIITVDLGGFYDLTTIDLTTYAFTSFNLGHPDDVTISTSVDNVSFGNATLHTWAVPANGAQLQSISRSDTGIRYIKLDFDGDETSGDKWGLTELAINGTASAIPEPATYGLLGAGALAGLTCVRRQRKAA